MAYLRGRKRQYTEENSVRTDIDVEKLKIAYLDLEAAYREVKETQIEVILDLAIVAEYKDSDTGSHILRISDYATELAKAIDLPQHDQDLLRYASPMHDIGKIGIPDRILQKPDKLNPAEWEIMKQHTVIGSKMFQNSHSPILKTASLIALTHHERYDGTGYPNGLKGETIPIFGRIVALVDVFDAIVSKRCYKSPSSLDEGIAGIVAIKGTHMDPLLVEAFIKTEHSIRKIYQANLTIQKYVQETKENLPDLESFR